MKAILEICAESYKDCLVAYNGGATRVELNSALSLGGLSPSLATLRQVKNDTSLEVICMVRPRAGGFYYSESEFVIMLKEAELYLENGADGIAFGFLNLNKTVHIQRTTIMTDLIHKYNKVAVFHRAFDITPDPYKACEQLIECGVDRVLTSGQRNNAMDGAIQIRNLNEQFGTRIEILAGCGVNPKNVAAILYLTGITQVHSSCKGYKLDFASKRGDVSFSYLNEPYDEFHEAVDIEKVKMMIKALNQ